jgi:hypothetical protein
VVHKKNYNNIVNFIVNSKVVKEVLPVKQGWGYRMYLLSRDKVYINDLVD